MSQKDGQPPEYQENVPRPLGTLHRDHGWTPEELRTELEAEGLDPDRELAKLRAIERELREKHLGPVARPVQSTFEIAYPAFEEAVAAGPANWVGDGCQAASMSAKQMLGDPGETAFGCAFAATPCATPTSPTARTC